MVVPVRQTGAAVADEILAILTEISFFFSLPQIEPFKTYFATAPYMILGIGVLLLLFRKKILGFFNSK